MLVEMHRKVFLLCKNVGLGGVKIHLVRLKVFQRIVCMSVFVRAL